MKLVSPEVKGYVLGYEAGMPYAARRYIPRGRLEANLRASEVLRKAAFIQSSILRNSWPETRSLAQAAIFLDNYQQDISRMSAEQIGRLPLAKKASRYILEAAKENTGHRLRRTGRKSLHTNAQSPSSLTDRILSPLFPNIKEETCCRVLLSVQIIGKSN